MNVATDDSGAAPARVQGRRRSRARDQLVADLMPLVRSLALRYAGRGEMLDDLIQVGAIGLINAIDRFDPDAESS